MAKTRTKLSAYFPPPDYAKWRQRDNWWTWELVHLVSCECWEPSEVPKYALAFGYDEALGDFEKDARDFLEAELRDALARKDKDIPVQGGEDRADGHRLLGSKDGLKFVLANIDAINDKIKSLAKDARAGRLAAAKARRKELTALKEKLAESGIVGKEPDDDEFLRRLESDKWTDDPPLLFVHDELLPLFDTPQSDAANAESDRAEAAIVRICTTGYFFEYKGIGVAVPNLDGFRYLCELLRHPYKAVDALALYGSDMKVLTEDERRAAESFRQEKEITTSQMDRSSHRNSIPPALTKEAQLLRAQADDAQAEGDDAAAKELRQRALAIVRPSEPKSQNRKASDAIRAAVKHSMTKIEEAHPALYAHISTSIDFGQQLMYRPAEDPHWQFE